MTINRYYSIRILQIDRIALITPAVITARCASRDTKETPLVALQTIARTEAHGLSHVNAMRLALAAHHASMVDVNVNETSRVQNAIDAVHRHTDYMLKTLMDALSATVAG